MSLFYCHECNTYHDSDEEVCYDYADELICEGCYDRITAEAGAQWRPLYEGEKLAGLIDGGDQ